MSSTSPAVRAPTLHAAVHASLRELPQRFIAENASSVPRRYRLRIGTLGPHVIVVTPTSCEVRGQDTGRVDAELRIDASSWLALAEGQASGLQAFLAGKLSIHGDLNEALRLQTLFAAPPGTPVAAAPSRIVRYRSGRASIAVFEAGPADAPPVLLLHGLGASKVSLLPVIAGLAPRYRVLAMDFPGFGKSIAPMGYATDIAGLAESALGVLDAAGIDRAFVVGNSMGGKVGVEMGLTAPERVGGLGLLCPAVAFDEYRLIRPLLGSRRRLDVALGLAPWGVPKRLVDVGLRRMFADPDCIPADNLRTGRDDFIRTLRAPRRRVAFAACARHLAHDSPEEFWERLAGLEVPSYWIFGDADPLVPCAYAKRVSARLPDARVEIWEACGHVPQFEHPERTETALDAFFSDHT